MEGLQGWLNDKKNMPIVAGVLIVIIIGIIVFVLYTYGIIGGSGDQNLPSGPVTTVPGMVKPGPSAATQGEGTAPGTPLGKKKELGDEAADTESGGSSGGPSGKSSGAPTAAPSAPATPAAAGGVRTARTASAAAAGPAVSSAPPMLPFRKDPFTPLEGAPAGKSLLIASLPSVPRPMFYRYTARRPTENKYVYNQEEPLGAQPVRRMAGVLIDGRISAILETNGESEIVHPGSITEKGDVRAVVESIEPTSLILRTLDTKTPHYIKVNLGSAIVSATEGTEQPSEQTNPTPPPPAGRRTYRRSPSPINP